MSELKRAHVPLHDAHVIRRCCNFSPKKRYQSMAQVSLALGRSFWKSVVWNVMLCLLLSITVLLCYTGGHIPRFEKMYEVSYIYEGAVQNRSVEKLSEAFEIANELRGNASDIVITMTGDEVLNEKCSLTSGNVTLKGNGSKLIRGDELKSNSMLCVSGYAASLTLDGITLDGNNVECSDAALEIWHDAVVTMESGMIKNNIITVDNRYFGSAVNIDGSTFVMNGGEILDNVNLYGAGGVGVITGSLFVANGGSVHDNSSTTWGAGNDMDVALFEGDTLDISGDAYIGYIKMHKDVVINVTGELSRTPCAYMQYMMDEHLDGHVYVQQESAENAYFNADNFGIYHNPKSISIMYDSAARQIIMKEIKDNLET